MNVKIVKHVTLSEALFSHHYEHLEAGSGRVRGPRPDQVEVKESIGFQGWTAENPVVQ